MILNSSSYKARRGTSLLELIIYFTIFAVIASLGAALLNFSVKGRSVVREGGETVGGLQRVLEQIIDRVPTSVTIIDASTTLNLQMASSTLNPTIISYNSGSKAIFVQEGASSSIQLSPSAVAITAFTLTKVTNPDPSTSSVRIVITGGYNDNGTAKTQTLYTLSTTALPLR